MTLLLSQFIGVCLERGTPISKSNQLNQTILIVVDATTRYSASLKERETMSCFLLFHEMRETSRKIENHMW
jgi:hypothetical protein